MIVQLKYAALSDVGLVRKNNQDAGYASPNLLVLADGMGGAAGGDVASSVAVAHLAEIDDVHKADELLPLLHAALNDAKDELIERAHERSDLAGLGTTCIAILRTSNKLAMVHIGDSRAYLLRDGKLTQVTHDHTLVQFLVDTGQITEEEAVHHPKRNVIMRAIGDSPDPLELDESIREAVPGDRWLLCSDGLFGVVSFDTISQTLQEVADLDECGEILIQYALAAGAPDNVTVVLADVIPSTQANENRGPIVVGSAAVDRKRPSRRGLSAAGRAAALSPTVDHSHDDSPVPRRRKIGAAIAAIVAILAVLGVGWQVFYSWTQTQYFVAVDSGRVAIYQGIPQRIGPVDFQSVYEVTDIAYDDLTPVARRRLESPITRASLAAAERVVEDLSAQVRVPAAPTDIPSETPSEDVSADPTPSAPTPSRTS